jgi:2',3'-cyclic-nucleotide 2'-phosphodiesterase (5'-nucleotidase family)
VAGRAAPVSAILVVVGDQHSAYDRTAQLVARVDRLKAVNPGVPLAVLIDGDTFEAGNVVAKRSGGAIEFAMLAALAQRAPTILNLGNHEPEFFDLAGTVARVRATGVVVIGSIADRATGKLFAPPSTPLRLGEADAVVVGVTTDALAQYRAAVRPSLDLANPAVWAKQNFPGLLAAAPVKIVLSHAGLKYDRAMFSVVPDGTLFAGAHDHVRFVQNLGRSVYFHSGSWNGHLSVVRLHREPTGPRWEIEQVALTAADPADAEMAAVIHRTREEFLTPEDRATIGRLAGPLARDAAARWVAAAVGRAAGVDAAFIGNTTFGDGLPGGAVSRVALDACVRFDGVICVAEVTGAELKRFLAAANQDEATPFEQRIDEALIAAGPAPAEIAPEKIYRIATTDWGAKNRGRYFGTDTLIFTERPELRLKAIVAKALNPP